MNPVYRSGSVTRWHANPDVPSQTLADHHGRVAQIVLHFWPDADPDLVYAALHHDCGELVTGDVPRPAKDADLSYARSLALREAVARLGMGIRTIDDNDPRLNDPRLRFADRLEAYTYVSMQRPHLLSLPEWTSALEWLEDMSETLDVSDTLELWLGRKII